MTPGDGDYLAPVDKTALRKLLRDRRTRYVGGLAASVRGLAFRVLPSPVLRRLEPGMTISLYYATGDEAPTENIALQLDRLGFQLALPRMGQDKSTMRFVHWDMDQILIPGAFRTLQPGPDAPEVAPDVIIAPLVGFDQALNRLGQGGGYYDRAFEAHPTALRIGLAWSVQGVEQLPTQPHDLPLDIIVTEAAILEREEGEA